MVDEKRDEDLLEEDEDDVIEEISDDVEGSEDIGKVAEDAVSEEDTVTGSDADDTVEQKTVEDKPTPVVHMDTEDRMGTGAHTGSDDHISIDNDTFSHAPLPVEDKPTPVVHRDTEEGIGTGAHVGSDDHISMDKDTFWKYLKIVVVIAVLILGYNYYIG